jgi:hypothetical protein
MAACKSAIERKTPRRMRCRVTLEKKFSTALSREAEVGVKWNVQRGWRDNKLRGAGYVVKCDHPSVIEAAWPAEALAITEAGRTALAKHRAEIAGNKGRRRSGDKRVIFRHDRDRYIVFLGDDRIGFVRRADNGTWNHVDTTMAHSGYAKTRERAGQLLRRRYERMVRDGVI